MGGVLTEGWKDAFFSIKKGIFMENIHADISVSVTELKRNFAGILAAAQGSPIAVLNHNRPEAYLVPARYYEMLLEQLEDVEDRQIVAERADGPFVEVSLDDL